VNLFSQFEVARHISRVNCVKITADRPRQMKFSALNVDFNSAIFNP